MRKDNLILVDQSGKFRGYASSDDCHKGKGRQHLAFVTLLFDNEGRVLLQRRKHKIFNNLWDFTAISHQLKKGKKVETDQEASDRALLSEMGVSHVDVLEIGAFDYFAKDGDLCENEYCKVFVGNYDGKFKPNPEKVYEVKKVDLKDFLTDIRTNSEKYTPWAKHAANEINKRKNLMNEELEYFLKKFDPYFKKFFQEKIKEVRKNSTLISKFYRELSEFSEGGKRMRAFLVYMGYRLGGGSDISKILPICLAIEILHSFVLIHDDVMDKSDSRRGKITIHKSFEKSHGDHYGLSQAINLGDIASFEGIKLIVDSAFASKFKTEALSELMSFLLVTGYGQVLDIQNSFEEASLLEIRKVAEYKTSRYSFVGPMMLGAVFSGASEVQKMAIVKYGIDLGIAFQLRDDYLGVFGDETKTGKSSLSDMREGKKTILVYKTKELSDSKRIKEFGLYWGNKNASVDDLKRVSSIIFDSGALEWQSREILRLVARAKASIANMTQDPRLKEVFVQIADFVYLREK